MTHKNPDQLKRLVLSLQHPASFVMIHLDRKTDIKAYESLIGMSAVHFVQNRVSVNWGGFSQVSAVLNSMIELIDIYPSVSYINLLSGQDYPVRKLSEFHEFLTEHPKGAFMEFLLKNDPWILSAEDRFNRYHLTDYNFFGKFKVERLLDALLPKRTFPPDFQLIGRSQWFTIDIECALYILNFIRTDKKIFNSFKYSWGSDELFFQSILYNSPLRDRLKNDNLRYIDWSENNASPKTLAITDLGKIENSKCFFARKFDPSVDIDVLNYLDQNLL